MELIPILNIVSRYIPKTRWLHNNEHGTVTLLYHPCIDQDQLNEARKVIIFFLPCSFVYQLFIYISHFTMSGDEPVHQEAHYLSLAAGEQGQTSGPGLLGCLLYTSPSPRD